MEKNSFTYIVTNKKHGTLYAGVIANLVARIYQHKTKMVNGFSSKYNLDKLVYYEIFEDALLTIDREKKIKHLLLNQKIKLIETINPSWEDLYLKIV